MSSFSFRKILLLFIWGIHFCFLSLLLLQPSFSSQKKTHKPLVVNTVTPQPVRTVSAPPKKVERSAPAPVAAKPLKTQPIPSVEKPSAKKAVAKTAPPLKKEPAIADKILSKNKKTPTAAPTAPRATISEALRKELEESIAKIEQKSDKKVERPSKLKNQINPIRLSIDTESEENDYIGILVGHLHQCLTLPEYGEVKIRLSLRQDGSVARLTVLNAQNKENKRYLETTLPHLRFPKLAGVYANQKECDFILTFLNEN